MLHALQLDEPASWAWVLSLLYERFLQAWHYHKVSCWPTGTLVEMTWGPWLSRRSEQMLTHIQKHHRTLSRMLEMPPAGMLYLLVRVGVQTVQTLPDNRIILLRALMNLNHIVENFLVAIWNKQGHRSSELENFLLTREIREEVRSQWRSLAMNISSFEANCWHLPG